MDIKKLLTLITSGNNMPLLDLENSTTEFMEFQYMANIYTAIASEDITVVSKNGDLFNAKKGDLILKSNCEGLYTVMPGTSTIAEVMEFITTQKKLKEEARRKNSNKKVCESINPPGDCGTLVNNSREEECVGESPCLTESCENSN